MKTPTIWTIPGMALLGLLDFSSAHYQAYQASPSSPATVTPVSDYGFIEPYPSEQPRPKDDYGVYPYGADSNDIIDYLEPSYPGADIEITIEGVPSDDNNPVKSPDELTKELQKNLDAISKGFDFSFPDDIKSYFPDDFDFDFDKFPFPDDLKSFFPDGFDFDNFPSGLYSGSYGTSPSSTTPSEQPPAQTTFVTVTRPGGGYYVYNYAFTPTPSPRTYY